MIYPGPRGFLSLGREERRDGSMIISSLLPLSSSLLPPPSSRLLSLFSAVKENLWDQVRDDPELVELKKTMGLSSWVDNMLACEFIVVTMEVHNSSLTTNGFE